MTIQQIEADIAAGLYVDPLAAAQRRLELRLKLMLDEENPNSLDDWDKGWNAAVRYLQERVGSIMEGPQ